MQVSERGSSDFVPAAARIAVFDNDGTLWAEQPLYFQLALAEEVYAIPPEQVIGSSIKTRYEYGDGNPVLARLPELDFLDDKEGNDRPLILSAEN